MINLPNQDNSANKQQQTQKNEQKTLTQKNISKMEKKLERAKEYKPKKQSSKRNRLKFSSAEPIPTSVTSCCSPSTMPSSAQASSSSSSSSPSSSSISNNNNDFDTNENSLLEDETDAMSLYNEIASTNRGEPTISSGEGDSLTNIGTIKNMKKKSNIVLVRTLENEDLLLDTDGTGVEWQTEYNVDFLLRDVAKHENAICKAAVYFLKKKEYPQSLTLYHHLLKYYRTKHGELHPLVGQTWHNIGTLHLRESRLPSALSSFQKAVRLRKGALGEDHPDVAVSLVKVGVTLLFLNRYDTALLTFTNALATRQNALGHLHPSIARVYNNIACVHVHNNDMRVARRAFESALDVQRGVMIDDPTNREAKMEAAVTLVNLGLLYRFRKMWGRALVLFDEAQQLQESVVGVYHESVLSTLDVVADTTTRDGNGGEALRLYKILLSRLKKNERYLRGSALILYKMSRINAQRKDWEAAMERLRLALKVLEEGRMGDDGAVCEKMDLLRSKIVADLEEVDRQSKKDDGAEWV